MEDLAANGESAVGGWDITSFSLGGAVSYLWSSCFLTLSEQKYFTSHALYAPAFPRTVRIKSWSRTGGTWCV
jgi:hypothetical protein